MSEAAANETDERGGNALEITGGDARVLVHAIRHLAVGRPATAADVERFAAAASVPAARAHAFLRTVTERDDDDNIVGALGLSLGKHPHKFTVDDVDLTTWCALDALFLPHIIRKPARVVSKSPASGAPVGLIVTPDGVRDADEQAVVSLVDLDAVDVDVRSTESIMMTFCRNIHFFPNRAEGEHWAAGRSGVTIATLDDAFAHGAALWPDAFDYAATLDE